MDTYFKVATDVRSVCALRTARCAKYSFYCLPFNFSSRSFFVWFSFHFIFLKFDLMETPPFVNKWVLSCNWNIMEMTTKLQFCPSLEKWDFIRSFTLSAENFNFSENHWKIMVWRTMACSESSWIREVGVSSILSLLSSLLFHLWLNFSAQTK